MENSITEPKRKLSKGSRDVKWTARWGGLLLAAASLALMFFILEVGLRHLLSDERQDRLPHFGITEDLQAYFNWVSRVEKGTTIGTTTYPTSFDVVDPQLGWRVKKNVQVRHFKVGVYDVSVTTNEHGLRGREAVSLMEQDTLPRIGVFGCSQTFGETVNDEENYVALLNENSLGAEFLNFGVRGYGTDQMLLYYDQAATKFDFDTVILATAFYHMKRNAKNFSFYAKPYFTLLDDGKLQLRGVPVPNAADLENQRLSEKTWTFLDHSVLARWTWQRLRNLKERGFYSKEGDAWRLTRAIIVKFVESAKNRGTSVVLLNIDEDQPHLENELRKLATELSVELINIGPRFREAKKNGIPYKLPNDNHWNPTGHEMVSDSLKQYFCEKGRLKCGA